MITEQANLLTSRIDQLPTLDLLALINGEDATIAKVVRDAIPAIAEAVDVIVERLQQGGRLIYAGAGTSGRLAMVDAVECVPTFNVPPELVQALVAGGSAALVQSVEGAEDDEAQGRVDFLALHPTSLDVVVGIAASGRTPYVLSIVREAREQGLTTIGISCNAPAPLLDAVDLPIAAPVGPEVITGSTRMKAGTAQKLILNMLSTSTMIKLGKVYSNWMVDVKASNVKLEQRARRIVAQIARISEAEAGDLLAQTDGEVKTAIVVSLLGVSITEARERLTQVQGRLRAVIGETAT